MQAAGSGSETTDLEAAVVGVNDVTTGEDTGDSGNGKTSDNGDDEDSEEEDDDESEDEIAPRSTRSRATLGTGPGAATDRESVGEGDDEDGIDETDKKARNEMEFVGQRELEYTWRPLSAPVNTSGFGSTILRCSTHSVAAEVLLAITDVLMLVTRKDRVFANKKLPGLKI